MKKFNLEKIYFNHIFIYFFFFGINLRKWDAWKYFCNNKELKTMCLEANPD
jgi:hypothetical protein